MTLTVLILLALYLIVGFALLRIFQVGSKADNGMGGRDD